MKQLGQYLLTIVSVLVIALASYFFITKPPSKAEFTNSLIGNNVETISQISRKGKNAGSFSFVVMGDSRLYGFPTFEYLIKKTDKLHPEFMIHLGDFVNRETDHQYRFFIAELKKFIKTPLVFTNGNHDLFQSASHMSRDPFHRYLGPTEIYFEYGNSLFIIIDNAELRELTESQLAWLKNILENHKNKQHIFICMHIAPLEIIGSPLTKEEEKVFCLPKNKTHTDEKFLNLIKDYPVAYVFSGHFHGHLEALYQGTTFVVTGGGGARLRQKEGFYHAIQFIVDGEKIEQNIISSPRQWSIAYYIRFSLHCVWMDFIQKYHVVLMTLVGISIAFLGYRIIFRKK